MLLLVVCFRFISKTFSLLVATNFVNNFPSLKGLLCSFSDLFFMTISSELYLQTSDAKIALSWLLMVMSTPLIGGVQIFWYAQLRMFYVNSLSIDVEDYFSTEWILEVCQNDLFSLNGCLIMFFTVPITMIIRSQNVSCVTIFMQYCTWTERLVVPVCWVWTGHFRNCRFHTDARELWECVFFLFCLFIIIFMHLACLPLCQATSLIWHVCCIKA